MQQSNCFNEDGFKTILLDVLTDTRGEESAKIKVENLASKINNTYPDEETRNTARFNYLLGWIESGNESIRAWLSPYHQHNPISKFREP